MFVPFNFGNQWVLCHPHQIGNHLFDNDMK